MENPLRFVGIIRVLAFQEQTFLLEEETENTKYLAPVTPNFECRSVCRCFLVSTQ